jgi:hypothetical protein
MMWLYRQGAQRALSVAARADAARRRRTARRSRSPVAPAGGRGRILSARKVQPPRGCLSCAPASPTQVTSSPERRKSKERKKSKAHGVGGMTVARRWCRFSLLSPRDRRKLEGER